MEINFSSNEVKKDFKDEQIEFFKYFLDEFNDVNDEITDKQLDEHVKQKYPKIDWGKLNLIPCNNWKGEHIEISNMIPEKYNCDFTGDVFLSSVRTKENDERRRKILAKIIEMYEA